MPGLASIWKQIKSPSLVQPHPPSLSNPNQEVSLLSNQMEIIFWNAETMQKI